jgi:UDP-glucose 4-epimerase
LKIAKKITNIIKDKNFDLLLHFAGFIKVEESVQNPGKYFKNNTDNAIKLFETCHKHNLKNIIFSSTAAAYGNPSKNESITENEILNPLNPYGESKVKTEEYLLKNQDKYNSIILRYFNVAGADPKLRSGLISDTPTHLIKILSEVAVGKREKISVFGNDYNTKDGTAIRDYIHVSDLASIHLEAAKYLLDNKISNIFNCGYGKGYSVLEVINTANKIYNNKIKFEYDKRRPGDSEKLISNVDKLHQHINWKPKFDDLTLIIKTAVEWEKKINEKNL